MRIAKYICQHKWTLGFVENSIDDILQGQNLNIKWLNNRFNDRWFADPFILDVDQHFIYLLVEEFYYPIFRGRIAKLIIDKADYSVISSEIVLELPTHLSFPYIYRRNNKIYIIPENYESGSSVEYLYDPASNKCIKTRVLSTESLMDAVLVSYFGEDMIFSTIYPDHNTLYLLKHDPLVSLFHISSKIEFPVSIARNGGAWFEFNNKIYRVAQDCSDGYGKAFVIQEVIRIGNDFYFEDVRRIESMNKKYPLGCHTFNCYKGVCVIDVKAKRFPVLFNVFSTLSLLKKRISKNGTC